MYEEWVQEDISDWIFTLEKDVAIIVDTLRSETITRYRDGDICATLVTYVLDDRLQKLAAADIAKITRRVRIVNIHSGEHFDRLEDYSHLKVSATCEECESGNNGSFKIYIVGEDCDNES